RFNGSLVEPVIYGGGNAVGIGILPNASRAFNKQQGRFHQIRVSATRGLLTHFPSIALDSAGNIHFSWADDVPGGKNSIWYTMLSPTGKGLVKSQILAPPR